MTKPQPVRKRTYKPKVRTGTSIVLVYLLSHSK